MKGVTVAMFTDYSYHGLPIEVSRIEVGLSPIIHWTPDMVAHIEYCACERLHSLAQRMPHEYWRTRR